MNQLDAARLNADSANLSPRITMPPANFELKIVVDGRQYTHSEITAIVRNHWKDIEDRRTLRRGPAPVMQADTPEARAKYDAWRKQGRP